MNALVASVIRTLVPIIVGHVVSWLLLAHVVLPAGLLTDLTTLVGAGLSIIYFVGARVLEQQWPLAGILLGLTVSPDTYSKGTPTAAVPAAPTVTPAPVADPLAAILSPAPAKTFPAAAVDSASGTPEAPAAPVETAPIVSVTA